MKWMIVLMVLWLSGCSTSHASRAIVVQRQTVERPAAGTQIWIDESQAVNRADNARQRWQTTPHGQIQPWIPTGNE